jgi:hypothetical protein
MGFSYKPDISPNFNNCKFNMYLDKLHVGQIIFHITYHEVTIGWLTIFNFSSNKDTGENRRKGYGTKMLLSFENYISKSHPSVKKIVLIPKGFDGQTKNYLCTFYEKASYIQEEIGKPFYIKNIY